MSALDTLRAAITGDVVLPESGITVTLVLPRVRDFFVTGEMPLPILEKVQEAAKETDDADETDLNIDDRQKIAAFNDWCVLNSVTAVDGETVTLTADDLPLFPEKDLQEIILYATRKNTLPGKD